MGLPTGVAARNVNSCPRSKWHVIGLLRKQINPKRTLSNRALVFGNPQFGAQMAASCCHTQVSSFSKHCSSKNRKLREADQEDEKAGRTRHAAVKSDHIKSMDDNAGSTHLEGIKMACIRELNSPYSQGDAGSGRSLQRLGGLSILPLREHGAAP